jgi:phosphatidylglycerophosphate synthase
MPPARNFFGQPQKLSHTTELPSEQAALIENSAGLRKRARCLLITTPEWGPNFLQLVSSKITMACECVVLADCPGALIELCGISTLERLLRTLQRCGIERATILSTTSERIAEELARPSWPRAQLALTLRTRPNEALRIEQIVDVWPGAAEFLLLVRGDAVFDRRLLQLLATQSLPAVLVDSAVPSKFQPLVAHAPDALGAKFCGAALLQRDWVSSQCGPLERAINNGLGQGALATVDVANQPSYSPALRRRLRPFWFPAPPSAHVKLAERILLNSVQKGTQDLPARIHAPLETFLLSKLCKTAITPGQLTLAWIILAFGTAFLFATGHLIGGILLALIIGILDGLDGKQARIKVETSKIGKIEHWFDSFFEVVWPTALAFHFYVSGQLPNAFFYLALLIVAEALDGIGKMGVYGPAEKLLVDPGLLDRIVRLVGGRRNIYVWVLIACVVLGVPEKALIVMAFWEAATAAVDLLQSSWIRYVLRRQRVL